jgi:hypothetical protein
MDEFYDEKDKPVIKATAIELERVKGLDGDLLLARGLMPARRISPKQIATLEASGALKVAYPSSEQKYKKCSMKSASDALLHHDQLDWLGLILSRTLACTATGFMGNRVQYYWNVTGDKHQLLFREHTDSNGGCMNCTSSGYASYDNVVEVVMRFVVGDPSSSSDGAGGMLYGRAESDGNSGSATIVKEEATAIAMATGDMFLFTLREACSKSPLGQQGAIRLPMCTSTLTLIPPGLATLTLINPTKPTNLRKTLQQHTAG